MSMRFGGVTVVCHVSELYPHQADYLTYGSADLSDIYFQNHQTVL